MTIVMKRFTKGIVLRGESSDVSDNIEGSLFRNSTDSRLKAYIEGAVRQLVTTSQTQTLTNKTLTSPTIDTSISGTAIETDLSVSASSSKLASASAIKTYVDNKVASKDEASEIAVTPAVNGNTNVQSVLEDHENRIDDIVNDVGNLVTLTGVAVDSTNLGLFTGTTIPDNQTIKQALQALETAHEEVDQNVNDLITLSGVSENATNLGVFTGTTIPDNQNNKQALQALETAHETHIGASTNVHGLAVGSSVVGTTDSQALSNKTLTGASIQVPIRSDVKQDTLTNLTTYALTATNGQIVYATDEKSMYQVVDGELVGIGGAGIVKLTAGENISARDLVYISTGTGNDSARTAGRIYKVDASNDDRVEVLGFATKAITSGSIGEVQVSGNLKGFTGLTAGKAYYASASSPGAITLTPPSTNGQWVITVCLASTSSEIIINPVAGASAIYVVDSDFSFTIANNQSSATNVTGLLFDGISTRSFILDYSIYRKTDTALSAVAQVGQLRGVYNTQSSTWFMSDDFSGQNAAVTFSIQPSGQIQYISSNIAGANYVGSMKYTIRKTFGV